MTDVTPAERYSAEAILRHSEREDHATIVARALLRGAEDEEPMNEIVARRAAERDACCRAQALVECRHGNLHSESTGVACLTS